MSLSCLTLPSLLNSTICCLLQEAMSSVAVCMVATFSLIAAAFVLMDLIPAMNAFLGVEKLPSHRVRIMVGVVCGASFILPFAW